MQLVFSCQSMVSRNLLRDARVHFFHRIINLLRSFLSGILSTGGCMLFCSIDICKQIEVFTFSQL